MQDLATALKGALSGSLEALMLGLVKSTAQYDAAELNASMKVRVRHQPNITRYLLVFEKVQNASCLLNLTRFLSAGTGDR